jgi:uncharacterized protein (TIGR00290 family)
MKKSVIYWSGGKDAMMALHKMFRIYPDTNLLLLTRLDENEKTVSMHFAGEDILDQQAKCLGLKLRKVFLPELSDNVTYSKIMGEVWQSLKVDGFDEAVFGDIFLEDIKSWNEMQLAPLGIQCRFPLWKNDTRSLADYFIGAGFKALIVAADSDFLDEETVGRMYDRDFIEGLPGNVDPCGENGEFHTFVFDGPGFNKPVDFQVGALKQKRYPSPVKNGNEKRFWYTRLIPLQ